MFGIVSVWDADNKQDVLNEKLFGNNNSTDIVISSKSRKYKRKQGNASMLQQHKKNHAEIQDYISQERVVIKSKKRKKESIGENINDDNLSKVATHKELKTDKKKTETRKAKKKREKQLQIQNEYDVSNNENTEQSNLNEGSLMETTHEVDILESKMSNNKKQKNATAMNEDVGFTAGSQLDVVVNNAKEKIATNKMKKKAAKHKQREEKQIQNRNRDTHMTGSTSISANQSSFIKDSVNEQVTGDNIVAKKKEIESPANCKIEEKNSLTSNDSTAPVENMPATSKTPKTEKVKTSKRKKKTPIQKKMVKEQIQNQKNTVMKSNVDEYNLASSVEVEITSTDSEMENKNPIQTSVSTISPSKGMDRGTTLQSSVINFNNDSKKTTTKANLKYSKFQAKLNRQLEGGQFRWINEKLYTSESCIAVDMFLNEPKLFDIYHKGFETQVQYWPENPVDIIIEYINTRDSSLVVADFGCGDAKISRSVPNKVHSFDLVAVNQNVTACDMKNVPLDDSCSDIAVFCLSLMGTNLVDFLHEAKRVLKAGATLLVAEVKSRFEDIDSFVSSVSNLGFALVKKNQSNKMFVLLEFENSGNITNENIAVSLKPCIYKRR